MIGHYLIAAYRNLTKNLLYTILNVAGLAIGLAACILILLYVRGEFSFDRFVPQAERIYRIHSRFDIPGRQPLLATQSPGPALEAMKKYFSEIETGTRIHSRRPKVQRGDRVFYDNIYLVDPTFFDVFDLPLIEGDRATALSDTASVILSETMAEKYFGSEPALGKTISIDDNVRDREFKVTGIIADTPKNSHLNWDLIARFEPEEFKKQPWIAEQWTSVNVSTYFKLKPGADPQRISAELPMFEEKSVPNVNFGGKEFATHEFLQLSIMPLLDVHLHETGQTKSPRYGAVMTFAAVAGLILIIACINFMNLATARASQRAREVALRKVVGANRRALIIQFLGESTLLALLSMAIALCVVELTLPAYNTFLDRSLALTFFSADTLLPWLLLLVTLVGVGGGLYPAVYLSRFRPAAVLKANKSSDTHGSSVLRNVLVVVQFAISIALIICTAVVYAQYQYTQTKDLGFDKQGMIIVRGLFRKEAESVSDVLRAEVTNLPGVLAVTRSSDVPGDQSENNAPVQRPDDPSGEPAILGRFSVDWDFFETYRVKLKAGRYLNKARGNDTVVGPTKPKEGEPAPDAKGRVFSTLINERAVGRMGYASPEAAVGQQVRFEDPGGGIDLEIVGVVQDYHYRSIRHEIRPTFYVRQPSQLADLSVRVAPGREAEVMASLEKVWKQHVPNLPFRGQFLEETLKSMYAEEKAQAEMFAAFAVLAIIIACLGLYGLASFTAARRTKEIGIRKVLGASSWAIVRLLVWQFSKPVLIANLIAWPIAAYVMQRWLSSFEYRIDLQPLVFLTAGGIALFIAWGTVAGHALRVSRTPPSRALRYE